MIVQLAEQPPPGWGRILFTNHRGPISSLRRSKKIRHYLWKGTKNKKIRRWINHHARLGYSISRANKSRGSWNGENFPRKNKQKKKKGKNEKCRWKMSHQVFAWCKSRAGANCNQPVRRSPSVWYRCRDYSPVRLAMKPVVDHCLVLKTHKKMPVKSFVLPMFVCDNVQLKYDT